MQRAKAFVFAAEEDFGITPLEAQAYGTPVIAFSKGAVLETIRGMDFASPTGVFFLEQTPEAVIKAIEVFEREWGEISALACRENALRFSPERFRQEFGNFVDQSWQAFAEQKSIGKKVG